MRAITEHVLAKNPARVLYVAGPGDSPDDRERFAGFTSAIGDRPFDLARGDFTRASGRGIPIDHDAVICANDQMALGVLDTLERTGRRDVLVTGFDGISAGRHSRPSLTTVHQPMVELGRAAISAVTRRLENPDLEPQSHTLPVRVILRQSCP
jgi:LacI family transcriptional regulator